MAALTLDEWQAIEWDQRAWGDLTDELRGAVYDALHQPAFAGEARPAPFTIIRPAPSRDPRLIPLVASASRPRGARRVGRGSRSSGCLPALGCLGLAFGAGLALAVSLAIAGAL